MSSFINNLYTKFLLRDILAKAVPGFLVLAYLFHGKIPTVYLKHGLPKIVVITVLYGLSFMTGMFLQFLGMIKIGKFSLISIYVHDNDQEKSIVKQLEFFNATKKRDGLRSQRERFVILKNMSGTFSIAILAIALFEAIRYLMLWLDSYLIPMAILFILFLALRCQNQFHANEQKIWEDNISN